MAKHTHFLISLLLIGFLSSCKQQPNPQDQRPNIILIMSDDMGYSDLGAFGGEIETPTLNRLAENGLRFTQFYNTARCCPTRASLMTGLYPHQAGIGHMTNYPGIDPHIHDYGTAEYSGQLNNQCVTIAEVLKEAGYATLMAGKWHLSFYDDQQWPLQRGFDQFYGIIPGACNFFQPTYPRGITEGNDTLSVLDQEDFYTTDAFTDHAIQYVDQSIKSGKDSPFFLYLAYNAPHWPIQAPPEVVEKYKGKYDDGWAALRNKRYQQMIDMGLIDKQWKMSPQDAIDWESLDNAKQEEMSLRMAIYAAMVDRMDQNIGRLIHHLEALGKLDNTLILFLNDNGACAEGNMLGGGSAEQLETKEGYFLTLGKAWANACNTPYREYKHWTHEGGIASPMIVHWPAGIQPESRGSFVRQYSFLPDVMATFLEVGNAHYPTTYRGNTIKPLVGKSMLRLIQGDLTSIHQEPIFWEHEGNGAVRLGPYKLVKKFKDENPSDWELYNIPQDRTELHNLMDIQSDKANEMIAMYKEWADKNHIMDWVKVKEIQKQIRLRNMEK